MYFDQIFWVLAAVSVLNFAQVVHGGNKTYSDTCTPNLNVTDEECNIQRGLRCNVNNTRCGCSDEHHYWDWDRTPSTCVATVHENTTCNTFLSDGSPAIPCTENARCRKTEDGKGRCYCIPFYTPDHEFKCYPSYGAQCYTPMDCNPDEFLTCSAANKTCDCLPGMFLHSREKCVVKLGGTCKPDGSLALPCTDSSRSECDTNTTSTCICKQGFNVSANQTRCVKYQNQTCIVGGDDCAETLSCIAISTNTTSFGLRIARDTDFEDFELGLPDPTELPAPRVDGTCLCKANDEEFNSVSHICEVLAGKNCTLSGNACVKDAACTGNTCQCNSGTRNVGGICKGLFGFSCTSGSDCATEEYLTCGNNGTCTCDAEHGAYNNGFCIGLNGSPCINDDYCDKVTSSCTGGEGNKSCACKNGYLVEATEKKCSAGYETSCSSTGDCFSPAFLSCEEGRCGCKATTEEWESNKCTIAAFQPCDTSVSDMPCISNSTCTNDANNEKKCICDNSMVLDADKKHCVNGAGVRHQIFPLSLLLSVYLMFRNA